MTEETGLMSGSVVFLGFCMLGVFGLALLRDTRAALTSYLRLFLIAYGLRFGFSVLIYEGGLVDILKDEDASGWTGGVALYEIWREQHLSLLDVPLGLSYMFGNQQPGPVFLRQPHRGFYFVIGALFYLTGSPYRLVAAALNGFAGSLTVVFATLTASRLFGPGVARRTGWYVCLFPSLITWSAMTVKEPIVICLETAVLYNCICIRQKRFWGANLAYALLASVVLSPFRFYATWVTSIITVLCVIVPTWSEADRGKRILLKWLAVPFLLVFLALSYNYLSRELENQRFDLKYIEAFRTSVAVGGEAVGAGSGVENQFDASFGGVVFAVLFGGAHLLLAPFPWQLGGASLRMLLTLPELLFWWYLFAFGVVPATVSTVRHRLSETWMLILFVLAFGVLYSAMFGNIGLVFRQRAQLLPVLLMLAAVGRERADETKRLRRSAASAVAGSTPFRG